MKKLPQHGLPDEAHFLVFQKFLLVVDRLAGRLMQEGVLYVGEHVPIAGPSDDKYCDKLAVLLAVVAINGAREAEAQLEGRDALGDVAGARVLPAALAHDIVEIKLVATDAAARPVLERFVPYHIADAGLFAALSAQGHVFGRDCVEFEVLDTGLQHMKEVDKILDVARNLRDARLAEAPAATFCLV